jgi:two-component system alkaline phosphatase synthesis response regulator PhoP
VNSTILIVDDEIHLVKILRFTLEHEGYNVISAFDGMEAINKIESERPDLVILDLMLPGIDGYKVCNRIKKNEELKDIPIIILSARDFENENIEEKILADMLMQKPFNTEKLLKAIDNLIKVNGIEI